MREFLKELNESLNEDYVEVEVSNEEEPQDLFSKYVYNEDIDGNKIPSFIILDRVALAEGISKDELMQILHKVKNNYKLYTVDAPNFSRVVLAAKEVEVEDIQEEFANYLLGKSVVTEIK